MQRDTLLLWGKRQLNHFTESAYLEATTLFCFVLKCSQTNLLTHPESFVSELEEETFRILIQRRSEGEPIAYLTGECEFWSLPFKVTPACLIPRPETELLVEQVLSSYPRNQVVRILDLGTGSGAIAIALSLERPNWQVIATDQSTEALAVAKENARKNRAHLEFSQGDWFEALSQKEFFHGIISNPPYLAQQDPHLKSSLRYEPQAALVGGEKGDEILHFLIQKAPYYLAPKGRLWLEKGFDQAQTVKSYFEQYGYTDIQQYCDLANIERVTSGVTPIQG